MKHLGLALLSCWCCAASPILVGPISLTGSGTLSKPDYASYGGEGFGGLGMTINASGTNGVDTVLINTWDIELVNPYLDPPPTLVLSLPNQWGCEIQSYTTFRDICGITIDGISGYGAFSGLGGSSGLLQVFEDVNHTQLLAQAEITNTVLTVTDVTYAQGSDWKWTANFSVVDPPSDVPEPSTLVLVGGGLLFCFTARSKR